MERIEKIAFNELLKAIADIVYRLEAIEKTLSQLQEQLLSDESSEM